MNKVWLIALIAVASFSSGISQEIVRPLMMSVEQAKQYNKEIRYAERETSVNRAAGIALPFIDDFSRYSLPTNDPEVPLEWQMWTDNTARINNSMAINPLTVGVATLDGLDHTGYPYDFSGPFTYGSADTLTSCPINLAGLNAEDSVKLVFHYEGGGQGNAPEFEDELLVEFLVPNSDPPLWQEVWTVSGVGSGSFQRVFIHVNDALWLTDDFQFRFRNYSSLSGNLDHWHIDYVWLDDDIEDADFEIIDVSAIGHETSLTLGYNTVPWEHYQSSPETVMLPNTTVQFRNLDQDRNINFGTKVYFDGAEIADMTQGLNTALNGFSNFIQPFSINDNTPNSFMFPTDVNDTCATFTVKHFCNTTPDINAVNDTVTFEQHFGNYYAYDDGSAEGAYALNDEGSAAAMRFNNLLEDSLLGLLIHFTPYTFDNSGETFLLRVWEDEGGSPGAEMTENFQLYNPDYYREGYDVFEYYEYDAPINILAGDFHVGIVQTSAAELNIGYDKSRNANSTSLRYKLGPNGQWAQSGVAGSLMIRPVFQSDKDLEWDFVDIDEQNPINGLDFSVYPNPAKNSLSSESFVNGRTLRIINSLGALVREEVIVSSQVDIFDLPEGIYITQLIESGSVIGITKFIKN